MVDTESSDIGIDESLEEAACWWAGPPKGAGDILSVIPENQEINIRFATSIPPDEGRYIRIYLPNYLQSLLDIWSNKKWAEVCLKWKEYLQTNIANSKFRLNPTNFLILRKCQQEAFNMLEWKISYLWGPPGTGKTFTLGALLAQFILQFPNKKVLLLSTTNSAVDQALISIDKSLENITNYEEKFHL